MGDADDSYDFENLQAFVDRLREGDDLVMGNRFQGGIEPGAMPPLHRYLGNPVLSMLGRVFFPIPVGDFHCGLRGFRTDCIRDLGLQTTGMEFASEMVVRGCISGLQDRGGPDHAEAGRSQPSAAPQDLAGRLAPSQVPADVQSQVAVCVSWCGPRPRRVAPRFGINVRPVDGGQRLALDSTPSSPPAPRVVGVQLTTFGALSRYYASMTGMLPRGPRSDWLVRTMSTDRVVVAAALSSWPASCYSASRSALGPRSTSGRWRIL